MPTVQSSSPAPGDLRTAANDLAKDAIFVVMVCKDLFSEIEQSNTLQEAVSLAIVGRKSTTYHYGVIEQEIAALISALDARRTAEEQGDD